MKKLAILLTVLALSGCTCVAPFKPSEGSVISSVKAPLQLEYNNTDLGHKVGSSSAYSVLGLFAFGDTSIQAASKNGNIKTIKHADYEHTSVLLGIFTKTTVFAYGD